MNHLPSLVCALCLPAAAGFAQVRMSLRNDMQIDTLQQSWGTADERFWPVKVNAFAAGDVDGDGDLDLLMADNDDGSRIWLNDGDGGFGRFVTVTASYTGKRCCALFDADGDGDLDALLGGGRTAYGGPGSTELFLNDGAGAFALSATVPATSLPATPIRVEGLGVGDMDGDGDRDVVLFPGDTWMRYWRNDGAATFTDQTASALPSPPVVYGMRGTVADVDQDGDLDIVTAQPQALWRNDGLAHFTSAPYVNVPIPYDHEAWTDVDGDGLVDRLAVWGDGRPLLQRNVGGSMQDVTTAWFEPHALVNRTYASGYSFAACIAFDADGDGNPDFVTGGVEGRYSASTTVGIPPRVYLNSGGQRFVDASRPALPMLQRWSSAGVAAGDIDGDGDVDLAVGASLWKQDAAGRFDEVLPAPAFLSAHVLAWADVDGDGDLDTIGLSGYGPVMPGVPGQHRLALNGGTGQFQDVTATRMPASAVSGGASIATGDVDGDGDVDVVIGSYSQNWGGTGVPLMLLANNGAGVFTDASAQLPATPHESGYLALRDIDADGDLDLLSACDRNHMMSPSLLLFVNNGSGTFSDATGARLPVTLPNPGLSVLDLDGDGDLDIAQESVDLRNDGTGTFTATTVATPRVLVVDLDGDGVPDPVIENSGLSVLGGRVLWSEYAGLEARVLLPVDLDQDADVDLVQVPFNQFGNPDWDYMRIELIYNLRRDLRVATLPRIGQPYRLHLRAGDSSGPVAALVAFSTATLPQRLQLPGLGSLLLDPALLQVFAFTVVPDADTRVEVSLPIPDDPVFLGVPLSCQALFGPTGNPGAAHLSNAMTYAIGG